MISASVASTAGVCSSPRRPIDQPIAQTTPAIAAASIDAIRPTVNVAAPEVNVAAPSVTVKAPDVNVPQANINVTADVHLPPPRETKIAITVDENGNAEGTVT